MHSIAIVYFQGSQIIRVTIGEVGSAFFTQWWIGLARGIGSLNLRTVTDIVVSWVITIPVGAFLAIGFYYILKAIFG